MPHISASSSRVKNSRRFQGFRTAFRGCVSLEK
nr:MAG TPA: hypothetical protein [Caudoviricetes sp.]